MHLPEIDKFANLKSPLHSFDPRLKIISFSILIFSIVLLQDIKGAFIGLILAVVLVFLSKIPFSFIFIHLRWVLLFIAVLFLIISLTVPGSLLLKLSFLSVSREGVKLSFLISLRAIGAVLFIFPMIGTTKFNVTLTALQKIGVPNKLIQLFMFTYRYIFLFLDEGKRIFIAANSRGWTKKTNISSLNVMGNLVGMLLVRSFERTEYLRDAMVSRGYDGRLRILDEFKLSSKDFIKTSLIIIIAILLHLFGWIQ